MSHIREPPCSFLQHNLQSKVLQKRALFFVKIHTAQVLYISLKML